MTDTAEAGSVAAQEQSAGNLAAPPATGDNGSASDAAKSWFDGLSEGNRKLAETKGWTTPEGADKALSTYAELERKLGEPLKAPGDDAPKEEWDKFYARLPEAMRPVASADKIEFKRPESLPENLPYDEGLANASKNWMVEAGLNSRQTQAIHDKFAGFMADQAAAQIKAVGEAVEKTHDDLVKDWGPVDGEKFKTELELANRAMKSLVLSMPTRPRGYSCPTAVSPMRRLPEPSRKSAGQCSVTTPLPATRRQVAVIRSSAMRTGPGI